MVRLDTHSIEHYLSSRARRTLGTIHVFDALDSTNSWLLAQGQCGESCLAESQTAGRGRRGHHWLSPPTGNIYLSVCWCFEKPPRLLALTSLLTGISVCDSLQQLGLQGQGLKWPNDILLGNKKLAGILVESSHQCQKLVIGIGLNVSRNGINIHAEDRCSLDQHLSVVPDRNQLVALLLDNLSQQLHALPCLTFSDFEQRWADWDLTTNKPVTVLQGKYPLTGIARGIDTQGHIKVELDQGQITTFSSAEISLRCSY